ncbi:jg13529 [Pararge aegeria aegeria]|uniref:Jg13529 protein n=1 Tax=Pararge aegeria aegeria TaxID=348720 RepID=A0A8S4QS82_9NEOP|nr:jg13529 [Pararge aegeria aegeria]
MALVDAQGMRGSAVTGFLFTDNNITRLMMSSSKNQPKRNFVSALEEERREDSFLKKKGRPSKKQTRCQETGIKSDDTCVVKIEKCSDSMSVDSSRQPPVHCPAAAELDEAEVTLKTESITFGCSLCYSDFTDEHEYNQHMCMQLVKGEGTVPPDFKAMLYGQWRA